MAAVKGQTTAADVARLAGVDRSTVSRILNRAFERHQYAPKTIEAVQDAARQLNYRPSASAIALRTGRSHLVGMIVGDIANSFFGELAKHVESALRRSGYRLVICDTNEDVELQGQHLADLLHRGVDGLIVMPAGETGLGDVAARSVPIVLLDRPAEHPVGAFVGLDNVKAGHMLGEHLRDCGYEHVGIVAPDAPTDASIAMRREGLLGALGPERVAWQHTHTNETDLDAQLAHSRNNPTTLDAMVGLTNTTTLAAYAACQRAEVRMPDEMGIAGIDDFPTAALLTPSLTVVAQPLAEIGRVASERLLAMMQGTDASAGDTRLLEPILIQRQSTMPR